MTVQDIAEFNAELKNRKISQKAVAEAAGVSQTEVSLWCNAKRAIPATRAKMIADALDFPLHLMRPDLWAPPAASAEIPEIANLSAENPDT